MTAARAEAKGTESHQTAPFRRSRSPAGLGAERPGVELSVRRRDSLGGILDLNHEVSVIISQPFVIGRLPTEAEIETWFQSQGYVEKLKGYLWENPTTGTRIADTHPGNFIVTDAEGKPDTPDFIPSLMVPIDLQVLALGTLGRQKKSSEASAPDGSVK